MVSALRKREFDPLEYIEQGFLDTQNPKKSSTKIEDVDVNIPKITDYLNGAAPTAVRTANGTKFKKTQMRAPRPRRSSRSKPKVHTINPKLQSLWEALPKNIEFLSSFFDDSITANYYTGDFKETREELMLRLLDPQLTLEETSRLLGVVPATVRRYTNRGWLAHHRTTGGQRRFRLSDIIKFVQEHGRFPEE